LVSPGPKFPSPSERTYQVREKSGAEENLGKKRKRRKDEDADVR